jgi:hypothetical protein
VNQSVASAARPRLKDRQDSSFPYTWVQWINVCIGVSLILTPFRVHSFGLIPGNALITGLAITVIALVSFFASTSREGGYISILNVVAGFWLFISTAFTLDKILAWQNFVAGILIMTTALITVAVHEIHIKLIDAESCEKGQSR